MGVIVVYILIVLGIMAWGYTIWEIRTGKWRKEDCYQRDRDALHEQIKIRRNKLDDKLKLK